MAPRIRFLAELIHDVYGFPLEPIEDGVLRSSKGLDPLSNGDNEKMARQTAKQQEVVTAPGRGKKADMDNLMLCEDWRHIGTRGSIMDSIDFEQEEKEEEEVAELRAEEGEMAEEGTGKARERGGRETSPVSVLDSIDSDQKEKEEEEEAVLRVVEREMAEEGTGKGGERGERSINPRKEGIEVSKLKVIERRMDEEGTGKCGIGRGTNPIFQLNVQKKSSMDINVKEIEGTQSTKTDVKAAAADSIKSKAMKEKDEAAEAEAEGIGREKEEIVQTSVKAAAADRKESVAMKEKDEATEAEAEAGGIGMGKEEIVQSNVRAAAADEEVSKATKKKFKAAETEEQDESAESHAEQDMLGTKSGGAAEGIGRETEEMVQSSADQCSEGNMRSQEDCGVKPLPNIFSRGRMRSLVTSVEEDCLLKVCWHMEGEVEIKDADILLAPSSRRSRVQVN